MRGFEEYYIVEDQRFLGPYDYVSILRKIRNRGIHPRTLLTAAPGEKAMQAIELPEFSEIFEEIHDKGSSEETQEFPPLTFSTLLHEGVLFLKLNLNMTAVTGGFLLAGIFGTALLAAITSKVWLVLLASTLNYFLFSVYQISVLRKTRMQSLNSEFFFKIIRGRIPALLLCSAVIATIVFAVPVALALLARPESLALIVLPGSFVLMMLFYAPLLVADRGMGPLAALGQSAGTLLQIGMDNLLVLYFLLLANFIAAATLVLIPIVLPVTIAAMCEVYDSYFNEY